MMENKRRGVEGPSPAADACDPESDPMHTTASLHSRWLLLCPVIVRLTVEPKTVQGSVTLAERDVLEDNDDGVRDCTRTQLLC